MQIKVNGENRELVQQMTVASLLTQLGYTDGFVAIAVNHACVPRSLHGSTLVAENDEIEILAPMSGG